MMAGRRLLVIWWRFYWRYALISSLLLYAGGKLLNWLLKQQCLPPFPLYTWVCGFGLLVFALTSYGLFGYLLGRKFRRSALVLMPGGREDGIPVTTGDRLRCWVNYFWRFCLLVFLLGLLLGGGVNYLLFRLLPDYRSIPSGVEHGLITVVTALAAMIVFALLLRRRTLRITDHSEPAM